MQKLKRAIKQAFGEAEDKADFINNLKKIIYEMSPFSENPVDLVKWIPLERIEPNEYNPNIVARNEMRLLYWSIKHDGYTQPIVVFHDDMKDKYIIVDGFHRYNVMKHHSDIYEQNNGRAPCVVLDKEINDRMASTVRHNRARGKHQVSGMSDIVFSMLENGWSDADVCSELGMEPDELVKLKHITGFSKLFEDVEYKKAWETTQQLKIKKEWKEKNENRA